MPLTPGDEYIYTTPSGQTMIVWIIEDCGMIRGYDKPWRKVKARPIGFNNCPLMILDFDTLTPRMKEGEWI